MKCFVYPLFAVVVSFILTAGPVHAQLHAPAKTLRAVADESMVVMDRGAKLEVLPTQRAIPQADRSGRAIAHRMVTARAADAIDPHRLGVVFNHAEQQQGYITGEIAFKMKADLIFTGSRALYPGLKRITTPEVYVVNARTPAEFIHVLKRLQARNDIEWVEPTVTYGAGPASGSAQ
jgi:hypothetical protein